ncbi:MAG: HDOD domain-containing protein [Vampirovibrionales bacterium]
MVDHQTAFSQGASFSEEAPVRLEDWTETTLAKLNPAVLQKIRDLPALPSVMTHLLHLMQDVDVPASRVAEGIAYDPALTSRVLRMVNSAAFGVQRQVTSIQHGMMLMGFNAIRGVVLSASVLKLFDGKQHPDGLDHEGFWWHSAATALIGKTLAEKLLLKGCDDAFTAGMLHDVGKLVLDVYFPTVYRPFLMDVRQQRQVHWGQSFFEDEIAQLGLSHTALGAILAHRWKLPIAIQEVMAFHHSPLQATHCPPLVVLVAIANQLAHALQSPQAFPSVVIQGLPAEWLSVLSVSPQKIERAWPDCVTACEQISQLFGAD